MKVVFEIPFEIREDDLRDAIEVFKNSVSLSGAFLEVRNNDNVLEALVIKNRLKRMIRVEISR